MKRASNGGSSIHEDRAGRWHGYVWMGTKEGGLPDRRHVTGKTRAVVAKKVRDLETRRDAGLAAQAGRPPTLGEWMDHWLTHIAARRLRPRTLDSYQTTVRLHLRRDWVTTGWIACSPSTSRRSTSAWRTRDCRRRRPCARRILSRALKVAQQRAEVGRNVAMLVDTPAAKRPVTPQPLDVEECRRVLASAKQGETLCGGQSRWPSGCGSRRRSGRCGATSTSTRARSWSGAAAPGAWSGAGVRGAEDRELAPADRAAPAAADRAACAP
jgi:integrase